MALARNNNRLIKNGEGGEIAARRGIRERSGVACMKLVADKRFISCASASIYALNHMTRKLNPWHRIVYFAFAAGACRGLFSRNKGKRREVLFLYAKYNAFPKESASCC